MKYLFHTLIILFAALVVTSCSGSGSSKADKLPPVTIEIPKELEDKEEVVDFIRESEKDLNILSNNLEELAEDTKEYIHKEAEELSTMEKIRFVSALGKFSSSMLETTARYQQMLEKSDLYQKTLSDEEAQALEHVMKAFDKRMKEINEKYKDYNRER